MSTDPDTLAATGAYPDRVHRGPGRNRACGTVDIANRYLLDPDDDDVLDSGALVAAAHPDAARPAGAVRTPARPARISRHTEAPRGRSDAGMTRRVDALSSIERLGQGPGAAARASGVTAWFRSRLACRFARQRGVHQDLTELANRAARAGACRAKDWSAIRRNHRDGCVSSIQKSRLRFGRMCSPAQHRSRPTLVPERLGPAMNPSRLNSCWHCSATPARSRSGRIWWFVRDWVARHSGSPHGLLGATAGGGAAAALGRPAAWLGRGARDGRPGALPWLPSDPQPQRSGAAGWRLTGRTGGRSKGPGEPDRGVPACGAGLASAR